MERDGVQIDRVKRQKKPIKHQEKKRKSFYPHFNNNTTISSVRTDKPQQSKY